MSDEIKLKDMTDFLENVYKDIKKQPTLEEELEKERKFINKIKGDNKNEIKELLEHIEILDNTDYILHSDKAKALLNYITNLQERKITKEDVDKYFEENMCVSFDKFIENWEEQEEFTKYLQKENEELKEELKSIKSNYKIQLEYDENLEKLNNANYLSFINVNKKRLKAIEYIKSPKICIDIRKTDGTLDFVSTDELLNILGGDE